jgi:ketosteroid isomerase-like protein
MRTSFKIMALPLAMAAAGTVHAATPTQVVARHVAAMKKGDLRAIMADYAANTVVIAPPGLVAGQSAREVGVFVGASARRVFATLTDKDHHPGVRTMQTSIAPGGPDIARLRWVQFKGTRQQVSGEDIFVVRGGKITYQAILVDPAR